MRYLLIELRNSASEWAFIFMNKDELEAIRKLLGPRKNPYRLSQYGTAIPKLLDEVEWLTKEALKREVDIAVMDKLFLEGKAKLAKARWALERISYRMGKFVDDSENLYSAVTIANKALKEIK